MVMQLERDVQQQLKRLEDDAIAGVHWLEHRLGRRVEELTHRLSKVLGGELDKLDDNTTAPRHPARPASPVEVQIMVESSRSKQAANAA